MRLDALRHLEPLRVAGLLAELLRHPPQVRRARILGAVDAMAEAGDLLLARELAADVGVDALGGRVLPDLEQHLHHFGVGAAVQRSLERADAGHDRRVHVGERRGGDARGKRRRVELVIRVQRQRDVHRARSQSGSAAARSACRGSWPRVPSPDPAATRLPPCCMRPQVATRLAICAVSRTDLRYDACWRVVAGVGIVVAERRRQRAQRVHAVGRRQHLHQPDDRLRAAGAPRPAATADRRARRDSAAGRATAGSRFPRRSRSARGRGCRSRDTRAHRDRRRENRSRTSSRRRLRDRPLASCHAIMVGHRSARLQVAVEAQALVAA